MKVISYGKHPGTRIWKGTCQECKSVMTETEGNITPSKVKHYEVPPSNDPREHSYDYAEMVCPVCERQFRMSPTTDYTQDE
jgi:hypothetical protein